MTKCCLFMLFIYALYLCSIYALFIKNSPNIILYHQSANNDKKSSGKFVWNLSLYIDFYFLGFSFLVTTILMFLKLA